MGLKTRLHVVHLLILGLVPFVSFHAIAESIADRPVYIADSQGREKLMTLRAAALKKIPQRPLDLALYYFDRNEALFTNQDYITIIDYRIHSSEDRMFILNLKTGEVDSDVVSHGKGSDPEHDGMLNAFSNVVGSGASSMGFYRVAETYFGVHGYSVRLDGLSSTNSNARDRAIVMHGADYVVRGYDKMGRSQGCPAVENHRVAPIIDRLKDGSLLFIYGKQFENLIRN